MAELDVFLAIVTEPKSYLWIVPGLFWLWAGFRTN